jgi:hypothetical protein
MDRTWRSSHAFADVEDDVEIELVERGLQYVLTTRLPLDAGDAVVVDLVDRTVQLYATDGPDDDERPGRLLARLEMPTEFDAARVSAYATGCALTVVLPKAQGEHGVERAATACAVERQAGTCGLCRRRLAEHCDVVCPECREAIERNGPWTREFDDVLWEDVEGWHDGKGVTANEKADDISIIGGSACDISDAGGRSGRRDGPG